MDRGIRRLSHALAALLALIAVLGLRSEHSFTDSAARAPATLVEFRAREVRSLFATETAHFPVVSFEDEGGARRELASSVDAERAGLATDLPPGTELAVDVLYDPRNPARARLDVPHRERGPLYLLAAATGLLFAPALLSYAFGARRRGESGA